MKVQQFSTGGDRNFAYLVADEASGEALVIDPSYNPAMIVRFAADHGFLIRYVFCTHGHSDHTSGNEAIEAMTGIRPLLFGDSAPSSEIKVEDGAHFPLGAFDVAIIHTPGHTADSICILCGDALFTGDTLFTGKVGGTRTEGEAAREYESLHNRLMALPDETTVYPGHDYGSAPISSIGRERATNPFLLQPDFAAFLSLKQNWAEYKKQHGIA
ncbi:MAG: hydroxyacylglutathione hydrolase family protein [Chlorobiaceae bacterium]